jgi:Flp pilus assembly pilin Flp
VSAPFDREERVSRERRPDALDERGQGLVEYALIIALVSLASVVALGFLSGKIQDLFFKNGNVLNGVSVAAPADGGAGPPDDGGGGPTAPASPSITSGPAGGTSGNTPAFTNPSFSFAGDGTETSFECSADGGAFVPCSSPTSMGPGLSAGGHSFAVQATNGGGSSAPTSRAWTVTAASSPPGYVSGASISCNDPHSNGVCDDSPDTMTISPGTWSGNPSPTFAYQWATNSNGNAACSTGGSGWSTISSGNGGTSTTAHMPDINNSAGQDLARVIVTGSNGVGSPVSVAFCRVFEN